MPDKNLHDIKVDELDSSKKSPITNILTLLALLFIILVISVVITKLILNTDSTIDNEDNSSMVHHVKDLNGTSSDTQNSDDKKEGNDKKSSDDKKHQTATTPVATAHTPSKILDRNLSSAIKTPLTSHVPKKESEVVKTYATPKKNTTPKKEVSPKHNATSTHNASTTHTTPKKEYIDKVVHAKHPTHTTHATTHTGTHSSSTKSASFLGGHVKKLTNSYYIKVGTYRDPSTVIRKVKKINFNYAVAKVENNPDLTRVLVGPFFSRNQAKAQLEKVKAKVLSGAYVTKVK